MSGRQTAEILPTHTPELFRQAVRRAAELLRAGELVALPTETVYGLAANALDPAAVAKIYKTKGRSSHNPIIVHVASVAMARQCVRDWPPLADKLASAFWPGPLTLVLPRSETIPGIVTAGGDTVGVRWPSHPLIQAVIREAGLPLAAPSANPSNQVSPTNAEHVRRALGGKIRLIIDGGQSQVGIESTVLDLSVAPPCVLRPGMIHKESLLAVTEQLKVQSPRPESQNSQILRSPGQLPKHYAPRARLVIRTWHDEAELRSQLAALNAPRKATYIITHTRIPLAQEWGHISVIPHDAEAFARAIYAELHRCDEEGAALIVMEALPEDEAWWGIADRLARAVGEGNQG
jgi:L-threonylcarbamoyladenylate synthase